MKDLVTAEGARAWLDNLKDIAAEGFRKHGQVPPIAVFLATRDDVTGRLLPSPREMLTFLPTELFAPDGKGKDKLALWMMRFARVYHACGFAFITEAWALEDTDIRPRTKDWSTIPGRKEVINMTAEHRALGPGTLGFACEIVREGKKATLKPWNEGVTMSGRFSGILSTDEEESQIDEMVARMITMGQFLTPEQRRHHIERARESMHKAGRAAPSAVDTMVAVLTARVEEAGQVVAPRPEDPHARRPDNDAGMRLDVVDINEWIKS